MNGFIDPPLLSVFFVIYSVLSMCVSNTVRGERFRREPLFYQRIFAENLYFFSTQERRIYHPEHEYMKLVAKFSKSDWAGSGRYRNSTLRIHCPHIFVRNSF